MRLWQSPLKKFFPQKEKAEYFLALILRDFRVESLVFKDLEGKIEVLGKADEKFSRPIEEIEQGELVEVCDKVISLAEENLPPHITTSQTILGLKDDWIIEGKIKKEYLTSLRRLKEDLELNFLGFVVIFEAVSHLLQKEEGVPTTSLLVSKEGQEVTIALVQAGRIEKIIAKKIDLPAGGESFSQILEKLLRTFKDYEILPSRIILFNEGENLEELKQELISFPWTKVLPFLHFPTVKILSDDFVPRAVVAGFATQMGVEFSAIGGSASGGESEIDAKKPEEDSGETFGFIREKDVLEKTQVSKEETREASSRLTFPQFRVPAIPKVDFSSLSNLFLNLRPIFFLPVLILILLFITYLFLPQATIALFVNTKTFEVGREVTIDPNIESSNFDKGKIRANEVSAQVSDILEGQATGKKEIGEKAKGEVTIYNKITTAKNFAKGTIISVNDLKFTLDDDILIASASDTGTSLNYGTGKARVTAVQIGEESNLPSNTSFTFSNFSTSQYLAKNENAFSGGSKKEVTVVSRQDQENLTRTLLDKLVQKAKEDILKGNPDLTGQKIVEADFSQEILEKKFSKNIDEEASKFSLTLKVNFKTLSFSQKDLESLFESQITNAIPQDFLLKKGALTVSFNKTKLNKDKSVSSEITLKATLLPKIDEKNIKNKIKGKSPENASRVLETIPNVSDYKIKVSPVFPILPKKIPLRLENIKIEILENA